MRPDADWPSPSDSSKEFHRPTGDKCIGRSKEVYNGQHFLGPDGVLACKTDRLLDLDGVLAYKTDRLLGPDGVLACKTDRLLGPDGVLACKTARILGPDGVLACKTDRLLGPDGVLACKTARLLGPDGVLAYKTDRQLGARSVTSSLRRNPWRGGRSGSPEQASAASRSRRRRWGSWCVGHGR